jgi:mRNA interferase MazF
MTIHRGNVYFVNLNPTVGREQAGKRPVVVVSNDLINSKPLVVVVIPGTRGSKVQSNYPGNVRVPAGEANLPEETVFLGFQVRALDHSRFSDQPIGRLSKMYLDLLDKTLSWALSSQALPPAADD